MSDPIGPGEGYTRRRLGGEAGTDESDVEGHGLVRRASGGDDDDDVEAHGKRL